LNSRRFQGRERDFFSNGFGDPDSSGTDATSPLAAATVFFRANPASGGAGIVRLLDIIADAVALGLDRMAAVTLAA
jgi:hypothetical protein